MQKQSLAISPCLKVLFDTYESGRQSRAELLLGGRLLLLLLQASQLDFSSVSSKCYSPQHVVQLDFSWSITKYSTIQNVWFWKGRYGAEDRCNLVSHYQRVSNQFQLVCSVWLWELCEKSLFLRSNKKLLSIWFCKCFLAAKICTGALGQIWKMRLWRGGDCSKSTSTKFWTSETVRLREELNLYRG